MKINVFVGFLARNWGGGRRLGVPGAADWRLGVGDWGLGTATTIHHGGRGEHGEGHETEEKKRRVNRQERQETYNGKARKDAKEAKNAKRGGRLGIGNGNDDSPQRPRRRRRKTAELEIGGWRFGIERGRGDDARKGLSCCVGGVGGEVSGVALEGVGQLAGWRSWRGR